MTIRHKAFKNPLDKGTASEWNDDHSIDFSEELMFYDTFFYRSLAPWWDTTQTTGGADVTVTMVDNHCFARLRSGTGAGDQAVLRLGDGNMTNRNDLPVFTASIRLDTTDKLEFGLFKANTTPFTANQNGAYFRVSGGTLYAVTGDGTTETVTDLGTPNTYGIYRIEFTATQVKFYVDDLQTPKASHVANIPTDNLTIKLATEESGGVSQIMRSDGIGIQRLRKT